MPCRRVLQVVHSPHRITDHLWITDDLLDEAFRRFLHVSHAHRKHNHQHITAGRRYGSNVPGPLEAHRRLARRRMGMTAAGPAFQSGGVEFGALFSFGGYGARVFDPEKDLKWKAPGREKELKDEHWMFPKSVFVKRKNAFDDIPDVGKTPTDKDPVVASKAAFASLLSKKGQLKSIEEHDLQGIFLFLQSAQDEPMAKNIKALCAWLEEKGLHKIAVRPLAALLLDKARLGTISWGTMSEALAFLLMSKPDASLIIRILDTISDVSLLQACRLTTLSLFHRTYKGGSRAKELPVPVDEWLHCLRSCQRLKTRHPGNPYWHNVYEVLALRTYNSGAAASHLCHLGPMAICHVILQFWVPQMIDRRSVTQSTTTRSRKRIMHLQPDADAGALLAEYEATLPTTHRGRGLGQWNPFITMLELLQKYGIPHARVTHHVFSILTSGAATRRYSSRYTFWTYAFLRSHRSLGVPSNLSYRLVTHYQKDGRRIHLHYARKVFLCSPDLSLSACYMLPIQLVRSGFGHSAAIWDVLTRLTNDEAIHQQDRRIGTVRNRLPQPHIDLIHIIADSFAKSPHLRPRVAMRRVWECYRFLRDRGAPITSLLSRAMVEAGILRHLRDLQRPPTTLFRYVISIVREIEGEDVAHELDKAIWTHWVSRTLPGIQLRNELADRVTKVVSGMHDAANTNTLTLYRLRQWRANRQKPWLEDRPRPEYCFQEPLLGFMPLQTCGSSPDQAETALADASGESQAYASQGPVDGLGSCGGAASETSSMPTRKASEEHYSPDFSAFDATSMDAAAAEASMISTTKASEEHHNSRFSAFDEPRTDPVKTTPSGVTRELATELSILRETPSSGPLATLPKSDAFAQSPDGLEAISPFDSAESAAFMKKSSTEPAAHPKLQHRVGLARRYDSSMPRLGYTPFAFHSTEEGR